MSDTISESLNPLNANKVCARSSGNESSMLQDENFNLPGRVLEPVSIDRFNEIVQNIASYHDKIDRLLTIIDSNRMVIRDTLYTLLHDQAVFDECLNFNVQKLFKYYNTLQFQQINQKRKSGHL